MHTNTFHCSLQTLCLLWRGLKPKSADSGLRMSIMGLRCSGGTIPPHLWQTHLMFQGETPPEPLTKHSHQTLILLQYFRKGLRVLDLWKLRNCKSVNNICFFVSVYTFYSRQIKPKGSNVLRVLFLERIALLSVSPTQSNVLAACPDNQTKIFLISVCWLFVGEYCSKITHKNLCWRKQKTRLSKFQPL